MRLLASGVAVAMWCVAWPAVALEIPDIDVDTQCAQQAAETNGGNGQRLYCLQAEQEGYNRLKVKWQRFPEEIQALCINKWNHYSMINYCLDDETRATEAVQSFKFKR